MRVMAENDLVTIPARHGKAARLRLGQRLKLVNSHGTQVVDAWAFNAYELGEFMSMQHSRVAFARIMPKLGDSFVTNKRRPILTLAEDTSPGIHDTLCAACDRYRYEQLGCEGYHRNCTDNLFEGMAELGLTPPEVPSPFNTFMNIPVRDDQGIDFLPTVSKPGDYLVFEARIDCVVAFSTCPQDVIPINGPDCTPREAHFIVLD